MHNILTFTALELVNWNVSWTSVKWCWMQFVKNLQWSVTHDSLWNLLRKHHDTSSRLFFSQQSIMSYVRMFGSIKDTHSTCYFLPLPGMLHLETAHITCLFLTVYKGYARYELNHSPVMAATNIVQALPCPPPSLPPPHLPSEVNPLVQLNDSQELAADMVQ